MQHLIIIRGNSGSGKSTTAKALRNVMRELYGKGSTMHVSQDVIRIDYNGPHCQDQIITEDREQ